MKIDNSNIEVIAIYTDGSCIGRRKKGSRIIRPGDWNCPNCNLNCYASKLKCFKCGTQKPKNGGKGEPKKVSKGNDNEMNPSGWAVVAVKQIKDHSLEEHKTTWEPNNIEVLCELFGPVITKNFIQKSKSMSFFTTKDNENINLNEYNIGAEVSSNNTGELSAIHEGLIWAYDYVKKQMEVHRSNDINNNGNMKKKIKYVVDIRYDSYYACRVVTGEYNANTNLELVKNTRKVLLQCQHLFKVTFTHVKGHSGDVFNDRADLLAKRGATGELCKQGRFQNKTRTSTSSSSIAVSTSSSTNTLSHEAVNDVNSNKTDSEVYLVIDDDSDLEVFGTGEGTCFDPIAL